MDQFPAHHTDGAGGPACEDFITNRQLHQSRNGFRKWERWFDDNKSVLDAKFKAKAKAAAYQATIPPE